MDGNPEVLRGASPVRTTCPYCGVGCGVVATAQSEVAFSVAGDPAHPANFGRLCSKGSALGETLGRHGRLLAPRIGGRTAGWDEALDLVAAKFRAAIDAHGPDSVAFYVSGQLLTEDYYVANKLMKGFIGSANIDTNSRLCMASSVAGHRRAFGTDTVPGTYEDLELADTVVLVGSNLAWCHPVLFQRLAAAKKARPAMRVIAVDPRLTATSDLADLHLRLAPGADAALFNGLLCEISRRGAVDAAYVGAHVSGFEAALAAAQAGPHETGLTEAEIAAFHDMWLGSERVVTVYSQGINQSSSGSDKVNAILNCHLATGRIGRPGMGPFSVTGQPNAMGGREVGGLANMLACHMELENPQHRAAVQEFWDAPAMPERAGLKAVDMFRAVGEGRIKALWIIHTNPAVTLPEADAVRAAIAGCDFVVVSDITAETDTARLAHVLLPATAWGEKDGTVTNSERMMSRQRRVLPAPEGTRDDWRILCDVAARMGWGAAFDYDGPGAIFREHAALSGIAGQFGLDFDISGLAGLAPEAYETMAPTRWPVPAAGAGAVRFFGAGGFFTADGRGRMLPIVPRPPAIAPSAAFPFRLNTGRVRDHWHTMTRTARSARLSQHLAEPYLEIHPEDAARIGLAPAHLAEVTSPAGRALLRVMVTPRVRAGEVFAPMHWTGETASLGRIDALVAAVVDPVSGQPESKASCVALRPWAPQWYGFAVAAEAMTPTCDYWALARAKGGWRAELAGAQRPADWVAYARALFGLPQAEAVTLIDESGGRARIALLHEGRLCGALFAAPEPVAVSRGFLAEALGAEAGIPILTGRPGADRPDPGATVCACFDVGVNTILAAIRAQGLASVEAIGAALQAGTNCGSCRPELAAILATARAAAPVA